MKFKTANQEYTWSSTHEDIYYEFFKNYFLFSKASNTRIKKIKVPTKKYFVNK